MGRLLVAEGASPRTPIAPGPASYNTPMSEPVVVLDRVCVSRGTRDVLHNLSFTIRDGEAWAITGPVGSGKTTLAETLLGRHPLRSGEIRWPLLARRGVAFPSDVVRLVAFKEESRLFSYAGHYYQQRFEFADADEPLTLADFLRSGTSPSAAEVEDAAAKLGLADRLDLSFMKLSNGQTRRARIARALLSKPELLILDDPFLGLDAAGRTDVSALLGELVKGGLRLVLICRPDAVPAWVTHTLALGERRGVSPTCLPPRTTSGLRLDARPEPVVELRNVTVSHGGRTILRDVNWTVRAGERWAVVGPNGSGKTTLLSLLCGDHPQAYSNDVRLFGRRRGTGESIWDVKRSVGLVSPEFHLYFGEPLTASRAAATGFFDTLTDRRTTPEQDAEVARLFAAFGILDLADRPFRTLSTGEQRLVLLARALVKRPPLLILDEPFQGLDDDLAGAIREWLDRELRPEQTLLFVSHLPSEIPSCVAFTLQLSGGEVV
jgi:molybdate transport system ATP-binding protein